MPCKALHSISAANRGFLIRPECGDQRIESGPECCRGFLAGKQKVGRQDKHRLVDNRLRGGENKIGVTGGGQGILGARRSFQVSVASSPNPRMATPP